MKFAVFCLSLLIAVSAHAGVIIDDFTAHPSATTPTSFTAPNLNRNPTFLRQVGLDQAHVLGGARSASLNAYSAIPLETVFDADKKLGCITFEKLAAGTASISYQGGQMGEARDLKANLKRDGAQAIVVSFAGAPSTGSLVLTVYSADQIETVTLPIKGNRPVVFPYSAFEKIDFSAVDGLTFEIQNPRPVNKKFVYEIARIEAMPLARK